MIAEGRRTGRIVPGLAYGGDYNPEQWSEDVWIEDIRLMREARVNLVTLGIFSWAMLETADDVWAFGWMDRIIELLHQAGIGIDLATPTAAPPIWLHRAHPDILPVDRRGIRYHQGGRLQWCASNPTWRAYALRVTRKLVERYGEHPAVRMWHLGNEFGGGNRRCYCTHSAAHFRRWLEDRHGTIEALNEAWGTAFWGLRFGSFAEVDVPLDSEAPQNPSLLLEFDRFSSDALLEHYLAERGVLESAAITVPITTNAMIGFAPSVVDYSRWAPHLDLMANDHYTIAADPHRHRELAFSADRVRGFDRTTPWLLMEHSTSAVNWQPRNYAKEPGELARNSLQHIARGADGALFFQWRASRSGAEQFHSAMVPHAGERTRVWREVVELGRILDALAPVAGTLVEPAAVAILADDAAGWAWQEGQKPLQDYAPWLLARQWSEALADAGILSDVVPSTTALDDYQLIVVAGVYAVDDATAARIGAAAAAGATVVVTHLSGVADEFNRIRLGGYPGAFRELVGVFAEEFLPLPVGIEIALEHGGRGREWSESLLADDDTQTIAVYESGVLANRPAITRRTVGEGCAWYISTDLDATTLRAIADRVIAETGIESTTPCIPGLEAVRRRGAHGSFLFLLNHTDRALDVPTAGVDLVAGRRAEGRITLEAGAVAVVQED
jgi:beta-galactosidase